MPGASRGSMSGKWQSSRRTSALGSRWTWVVATFTADALGRCPADAHAVTAYRELDRGAVEQRQPSEIVGVPALCERIAGVSPIVVAEHCHGRLARHATSSAQAAAKAGPARRRATRSPVTATMSG